VRARDAALRDAALCASGALAPHLTCLARSPPARALPRASYSLILLDSEGIDAFDQTGAQRLRCAVSLARCSADFQTRAGQYSTQIFALAVLLSSLFVYNQLGAIDEAALDRLALVSEVSKTLVGRTNGPGGAAPAPEALAAFAPSFLWLLRDFYLDLRRAHAPPAPQIRTRAAPAVMRSSSFSPNAAAFAVRSEDGQQITPREYLETALRLTPGSGAAVASKNEIRRSIAGLFAQRDCFALVRPVNDEKQLQQLDCASMPLCMHARLRICAQMLTRVLLLCVAWLQRCRAARCAASSRTAWTRSPPRCWPPRAPSAWAGTF
jgi:hypothetical protein